MKPTLFGLSESVYTRIARLVFEEKGVEYEFEEVDIFGDDGVPADYLKLHPFGRIPSLTHGGFALYETSAIIRYVDEAFDGPVLQPDTPELRARMNLIISLLDSYAYRSMIWDVFVERVVVPEEHGTPNEVVISGALHIAQTCLDELELRLWDKQFFLGPELTLADLHAAPMLLYFAQTPEGERMLESKSNLVQWMGHMRLRHSIERTKSIYG